MRLPVGTDEPSAVNCEYDRQLLQTYVFQDLVVSPLQEGGIDRNDRLESSQCQSRRKCHSVLLCDPHVKKAIRVSAAKILQSHTVFHRCCDRHERRFGLRQFHHRGREDICIRVFFDGLHRFACLDREGRRSVKSGRPPLRGTVSLSLSRAHMDQDCLIDAFRGFNGFHHMLDVVSVDRSEIDDPHLFKEHAGHHQRLQRLLGAADPFYHAGKRFVK